MKLIYALLAHAVGSFATPQRLGEFSIADFDHVIVLPDIHGDLVNLMHSIHLGAKKTNYPSLSLVALEGLLVSGGRAGDPVGDPRRTAFVQLGDVANRGPGSKQCFAVLSSLESVFGWRVIRLIGNHELMAFTRKDGRYVHSLEPHFFDGAAARAHEYSMQGALWQSIAANSLLMARFSGSDSPGSNTLFVHAGLNPTWLEAVGKSTPVTVHGLNMMTRFLLREREMADKILSPNESPVWTRDFETLSSSSPSWCDEEFSAILATYNVDRIVVGHMPLDSKRVEGRCEGRLILADVKISQWMQDGGQPMALVINNSGATVTAHYLDPDDLLTEFSELVVSDESPESPSEETKISDHTGRARSVSMDSVLKLRENSEPMVPRSPRSCVKPPPGLWRASSCPFPRPALVNVSMVLFIRECLVTFFKQSCFQKIFWPEIII